MKLNNEVQSAGVVLNVPAKVAQGFGVFPFDQKEGKLYLYASKNLSREDKEELPVILGRVLAFEFKPQFFIQNLINEHYGISAETIADLTDAQDKVVNSTSDLEDLDSGGEAATVMQLVNDILRDAIQSGASDIHIEPFDKSLAVRYRVDGILVPAKISSEIKRLSAALISRLKIMAGLDIGERRLPQDGRVKVRQNGRELDLRLSVLPSAFGEAAVIRILKSLELLDLTELGFDNQTLASYRGLLKKPYGLVLITGPTGSGKTTTLYAGLKEINSVERKIVTIEDPIEYRLKGILQLQVHEKIGFGFAEALRSVLRHDPDIVMVGEIRDRETAEIAVRSALTGHLVFSTLHTNDAASAVTRLVEMGVEPYLVSASLQAVLAQRLVRRKNSTGDLKGRTVLCELMLVSEKLKEMAAQGSSASQLQKVAVAEGMKPLLESGKAKVCHGLTTNQVLTRAVGLLFFILQSTLDNPC